ncbi:hypothetical protein BST95_08410 [Halioglobus japonicus]|uniref:Alkaline serine protease n=1 Tax=Halioglobus japonicus TaxID=930805 RepID=A0AAP8MEM1_9GAMM|nr:S8 family peptidase [Halioglobus japonicus]AQA18250.1 hypothetical protein BST95_08410 [Halioglobus japonicus]PLW86259.1 alkaline serine protease [Halioglobus japonicus]GHD13682.1 hypothetical protein GCM10007052_16360 [Halioglobus japonicus]
MKYLAPMRATLIAMTCAVSFTANSEEQPLHVMLQGESADAMAALVATHKGEITHQLPIIDAVGAQLNRQQLEAILVSDKVHRYIDDLAFDPPDEYTEPSSDCNVAGYLQLEFSPDSMRWRLINKSDAPAKATQIDMTWPAAWGAVTRASVGDSNVAADTLPNTPGKMSLALSQTTTTPFSGTAHLEIEFANKDDAPSPERQNKVSAAIHFGENCKVESPPAYPDNHNDFYYATVAGADSLHLHDIRGAGVTVAVLDSGLWEHDHLSLNTQGQPRVLGRYDAINGREVDEAFDESGHGSHMTSILGNSGPTLRNGKPTGSFKGIAPDANLVTIKAFNVEGQGGMLDIVRGVQWAIDNREKFDIRVLNLSFASRPRWPYFLDPVNQAVMRAWQAGIVVVAAAGNEGPELMSVGSPGNLPYIITVGAITDSWTPLDRSDDYLPDFSSRGPTPSAHIKPDIVAPGGHMTGLTRPGSSLTKDYPEYVLDTGEFVMTGSSQAAALVSGLVALLLQLEPELTPDDVKCMLTSTADLAINHDGLLSYSPFEQGQGYVSITRAITLGRRGCGNEGLSLADDIAGQDHFQGPAIITDEGDTSLPGLELMLSPFPAEKGRSDTRVWGIKSHVERLPPDAKEPPDSPFQWLQIYEMERRQIEQLGKQP